MKPGQIQASAFSSGEGDAWFNRNRDKLGADPEHDEPLKLLELVGSTPNRVLEIGAANGFRLEWLRQRYGASCSGVEPSADAVEDGVSRYPEISLKRGLAHKLAFPDGSFDLVIINFVLHWIDRNLLTRTMAEIDRVLEDGGHVLIGDFSPDVSTTVGYHHLPDSGLWTYKQNYPGMFEATELYRIVAGITWQSGEPSNRSGIPSYDRAATTLLEKCLGLLHGDGR